MPVATIQAIEGALKTHLEGATVQTRDSVSSTVPVFLDSPDVEEFPERVYPSISIMLMDCTPDFEREDTTETVEISVDKSSVPYVATMRDASSPYRLSFMIHTWAMHWALTDRELMRWVSKRLPPRTTIPLSGENFWTFYKSSATLHEDDGDQKIYHRAWTYDVLLDLEDVDTDEQSAQVSEIRLRTGLVTQGLKLPWEGLDGAAILNSGIIIGSQLIPVPIDASGNPVDNAADAKFVFDREVAYDEDDLWIP